MVVFFQQHSGYRISRVCTAGSAGKNTNISSSDFDVVLFLNDTEPPFRDVKREWKELLLANAAHFNVSNIKNIKYSVRFTVGNFSFDFSPAPNLVRNNGKRGRGLIIAQQNAVLERIAENPRQNRNTYAAGLAEAGVDFMLNRNSFANEMARIAKCWLEKHEFSEYISGKNTFIELVAVYSAKAGFRGTRKRMPYLKCFARILRALMNFNGLNVVFGYRQRETYKGYPLCDMQCPRVIDPVNPFNNFVRNWSYDSICELEEYALYTYQHLQEICSLPHLGGVQKFFQEFL